LLGSDFRKTTAVHEIFIEGIIGFMKSKTLLAYTDVKIYRVIPISYGN